jgi:hypothetical protein
MAMSRTHLGGALGRVIEAGAAQEAEEAFPKFAA